MIQTLVNFSGGLDSTYVAWKWLMENQNSTLLIHHVNLICTESIERHKLESAATKQILHYFKCNGLNNFKYIESTFDYSQFGYTVRDADVIHFLTGVLLRSHRYKHLNSMLMPYSSEDFLENDYTNMELRRYQLMRLISDNREMEFEFPIRNQTRQELIAAMPLPLFRMCWFCRRPINGQKCGKCRTCKQTI